MYTPPLSRLPPSSTRSHCLPWFSHCAPPCACALPIVVFARGYRSQAARLPVLHLMLAELRCRKLCSQPCLALAAHAVCEFFLFILSLVACICGYLTGRDVHTQLKLSWQYGKPVACTWKPQHETHEKWAQEKDTQQQLRQLPGAHCGTVERAHGTLTLAHGGLAHKQKHGA